MRKRFIIILSALCFLFISLLASCSRKESTDSSDTVPDSPFISAEIVSPIGDVSDEVRGVWIASVYNINFPSSPDLSDENLKNELDDIIETAVASGLNTIYFQVHPASDSLYKSELFPVSEFLFTDGVLHFDPLEYMIGECHKNGVSLYAWLNPLRVSVSAADSEEEATDLLSENSPGRDDSLTTYYGDGKLYLNCGRSAVRELIADAVEEIVQQYEVDGIVFDDYFYPYPAYDASGVKYEFDDTADHAASGTTLSLEDWRRDNVNQMVKLCYERIKKIDTGIKFGVAPFGIWQNDDGTNGGSATSGMEAYSELYCDASAWISGGYIDFISPQLYWECTSTAAPFSELVDFWNCLTDGTDVDLIISHGLYRYDGDWTAPEGELTKQVSIARSAVSYKGSILYGYDALKNNSGGAADDTVESFSADVYYYNPAVYNDGIIIDVTTGVSVEGSSVIFRGYSDGTHPLTVNGKKISRSKGGYFECELMLELKKNSFVFTCGDKSKTVTIMNNSVK